MAEFLYQIKPTRPQMLADGGTEAERAAVAAHFEYLQRMHRLGVVQLAGRTDTADESAFGIVLLTADDEAEAVAAMNADPAIARGVMDATLFPFRTALG